MDCNDGNVKGFVGYKYPTYACFSQQIPMPTGLDSRLRRNDGLRGFKKMKDTRPSEKRFSFVEAILSDDL